MVVSETSGSGYSPQQLIGTIFGDYWRDHEAHLPSAAILDLVGDFGVTGGSTRAALGRLKRRGILESSKEGRNTLYGLSPRGRERILAGARRIASFGVDEPWNQRWCGVVFSFPEDQKDVRHLLRSQLTRMNFAPLYDGFWISPRATANMAEGILDQLAIDSATVFETTNSELHARARAPIEAWNLEPLAARYRIFIESTRSTLGRLQSGFLTSLDAFVARTTLMHDFHEFRALDPMLPLELLPPDWPRSTAREVFVKAYDELGPLAALLVQATLAKHGFKTAKRVQARTTAEIAAVDELGPGR